MNANENLHVALLLRSLGVSGTARVMLQLAEGIAARGHRVDLVVCRPTGEFEGEVSASVTCVPLAPRGALATRLRFARGSVLRPALRFQDAGWVRPFAEYLQERRPDVVLSAATFANVVAIWGRKLAGVDVPIVLSQHNHFTEKTVRPNRRWKRPLVRDVYPRADALVGVSQGVSDDLADAIGVPRDRVHTIYNPIVDAKLLERARAVPDHPWFQDGEPPVVLAAGRFKTRKDFAMLLRAFAGLRAEREARLVILGEGSERPSLEQLVAELGMADHVDLPGFTDNPYMYMARAAVFALPSRWEGFSAVIAEALACGCPVVSTDCPSGPAEVLDHGKYGTLVPIGDVRAMKDALVAALDAPPPADSLRARGRAFSVERATDAYLAVLTTSCDAAEPNTIR